MPAARCSAWVKRRAAMRKRRSFLVLRGGGYLSQRRTSAPHDVGDANRAGCLPTSQALRLVDERTDDFVHPHGVEGLKVRHPLPLDQSERFRPKRGEFGTDREFRQRYIL